MRKKDSGRRAGLEVRRSRQPPRALRPRPAGDRQGDGRARPEGPHGRRLLLPAVRFAGAARRGAARGAERRAGGAASGRSPRRSCARWRRPASCPGASSASARARSGASPARRWWPGSPDRRTDGEIGRMDDQIFAGYPDGADADGRRRESPGGARLGHLLARSTIGSSFWGAPSTTSSPTSSSPSCCFSSRRTPTRTS